MPNPRVLVLPKQDLARQAAELILAALTDSVRQRGWAYFMLAGGTTPRATYQALAEHPEGPWNQLTLLFGDERAVPATDPESNYAMACRALLDHVPVLPEHVHRLEADDSDLKRAAAAYSRLLPARVDVLVLGVGSDGHTASLLPHAAALEERGARIVTAVSPKPPKHRLTITPDVIRNARACFVLAAGADKAIAVARALAGPEDLASCPAQLARAGVWLLDPEAARCLERGTP